VRGRTLRTHPLGHEILAGVSRAVVLELGRAAGMRIEERRFTRRALYDADEAFLSSTMQEVLPVVQVDGRRIGDGLPGRWTLDLHERLARRARRASARAGDNKLQGGRA
jgi:branched-subunit amino acid aminotransferase/4-amino-4-deoxychorismate lyase